MLGPARPDLDNPDGDALGCINNASGPIYKFATDSIKFPTTGANMSYSIDIDGDGVVDNALKGITSVVSAMIDLNMTLAESIAKGDGIVLAEVQAENLNDACAKVTLHLAQKGLTPPKLDGTDTFTIDPSRAPTVLWGKISNGVLNTITPKDQRGTQVQKLDLILPFIISPTDFPIIGVHLQSRFGKIMKRVNLMDITVDGILDGQIHGVILTTDLDGKIIPAIADGITNLINDSKPGDSTATIVIGLFQDKDTPGSVSAMKCMAHPEWCCGDDPASRKTCKILPEEVKASKLVGAKLKADVQVNQNGVWNPVPMGTMKDAWSLGIGYTSVKSNF